MNNSFEGMTSLELLLESLIKMVGRSNDRVDDLAKRVNQLEMYVRETGLAGGKMPRRSYSFIAEANPELRKPPPSPSSLKKPLTQK